MDDSVGYLKGKCPNCGKVLKISKKYAEKTGTCTECRSPIAVPPLAQASEFEEAPSTPDGQQPPPTQDKSEPAPEKEQESSPNTYAESAPQKPGDQRVTLAVDLDPRRVSMDVPKFICQLLVYISLFIFLYDDQLILMAIILAMGSPRKGVLFCPPDGFNFRQMYAQLANAYVDHISLVDVTGRRYYSNTKYLVAIVRIVNKHNKRRFVAYSIGSPSAFVLDNSTQTITSSNHPLGDAGRRDNYTARIKDDLGNTYEAVCPLSSIRGGKIDLPIPPRQGVVVSPNESVQVAMIFERPKPVANTLRLRVPCDCFGGSGPLLFDIPSRQPMSQSPTLST